MKLVELAGTKRFSQLNPEEALKFLQAEFAAGKTKLRALGSGANAVALTNGSVVFKLWHKDSAYEKFINFCLGNDSKFLPKFKSKVRSLPKFLKLGDSSDDIRYVKMELLKPYAGPEGFTLWNDPELLKKLGDLENNNFTSFENIFDASRMSKRPPGILKQLLYRHQDYNDIKFDLLPYMDKVNPDVIAMIEVLSALNAVMSSDDRHDYAARNMALRGDQPVILDPIVNDDDLEANLELVKLQNISVTRDNDL